jgi:hypothetical protein
MFRILAMLTVTVSLTACGAISGLTDLIKHKNAVEAELEEMTGVKPAVGFDWNNGVLRSVTVVFPDVYERKPLRELAHAARLSVTKHFKQAPGGILLGFALPGSKPDNVAYIAH